MASEIPHERAASVAQTVALPFVLAIEDGWPPVAIENLPCTALAGGYRVEVPPLFVKNLSCGDVIVVTRDEHGHVSSWRHLRRSGRSTLWLLRLKQGDEIEVALEQLRALKCHTVELAEYGCYAIDVPEDCAIEAVDTCLEILDRSRVAVAFPSFRHEEP